MKKAITATILSFLITMSIVHDGVSSAIVNFMIIGAIPGTDVYMPFWAMIVLCTILIAIIITLFVETTFFADRSMRRVNRQKTSLPRRRFSNI